MGSGVGWEAEDGLYVFFIRSAVHSVVNINSNNAQEWPIRSLAAVWHYIQSC